MKHIDLQEIIWEITSICHNHCDYCGTIGNRNNDNQQLLAEDLNNIAQYIIDFHQEHNNSIKKINISGGDPLLVGRDVHEFITSKFRENKITSTIIINPKSIINDDLIMVINMYDLVGISVNTLEELQTITKVITTFERKISKPITIITNFSIVNFILFDKIYNLVKTYRFVWQIQYTMFNGASQLAIYSNTEYNEALINKLNNCKDINLIIADNANDSSCSAGIKTISIAYNGNVIPCLALLTFKKRLELSIGNILHDKSLTKIWEEQCNKFRHNTFQCCKEFCNNQQLSINKKNSVDYNFEKLLEQINPLTPDIKPRRVIPDEHVILVYGVGGLTDVEY